jgi:hydrogenase maturation protease
VRPRTLVAGIGNIFCGDDGFGCEVVRRLSALDAQGATALPEGVRVVDYGIRGMHLAYDLLDGWDLLYLVDALPDRGAAGRLEILEVRPEQLGTGGLDAHAMAPVAVLSSLETLGGRLPPTVLVGAQVSDTRDRIGLSAEMEKAVPQAVDAIQALLRETGLPPSAAGAGDRPREEVR